MITEWDFPERLLKSLQGERDKNWKWKILLIGNFSCSALLSLLLSKWHYIPLCVLPWWRRFLLAVSLAFLFYCLIPSPYISFFCLPVVLFLSCSCQRTCFVGSSSSIRLTWPIYPSWFIFIILHISGSGVILTFLECPWKYAWLFFVQKRQGTFHHFAAISAFLSHIIKLVWLEHYKSCIWSLFKYCEIWGVCMI